MDKETHLQKNLEKLGLSEAETAVYLFIIKNGASSVQTITDAVALPRSTVNLSVEHLVENGLVSFFTRGKRKNYVPRNLDSLMNYLIPEEQAIQEKKKTVLSLMPDLESIFYLRPTGASNVEFFEGEDGLKKLYEMTLENSSKEILRLSVASEKFNFIPDFLRAYVEKKNKKGIKTRLLLPDTEFSKSVSVGDTKDHRTTRFLDKDVFNPDVAVAIWDENVALTAWDKRLKTTLLKSKVHADFFRSVFEILWKISHK